MTNEYTKSERKQLAKAFREAKKYLWDGSASNPTDKDAMICFCLDRAECAGAITDETAGLARTLIGDRLCGYPGVRTWLRDIGVPHSQLTSRNVQAHRHAWLDALIAEFSQP